MRKALAALVAAALLLAPAAEATISAPQFIGSATLAAASGNNSIQITTTADCPLNSLLVVAALVGSNVRSPTSIADDSTQVGIQNLYVMGATATSTTTTTRQGAALITRDVPLGRHLTVSVTTGNAQAIIAAAVCIPPGMATATPDSNGTGASGASTNNPHFTASAATVQANEIVFSVLGWNNSTTPTITWGVDGAGNPFTSVATIPNGSVGYTLAWAYAIDSAINTPATSISTTSSLNWLVNLYSYRGGAAILPGSGSSLLLGAG